MRFLKPSDRLALLAIVGVVTPALLLAGMVGFASQVDTRSRERQEKVLAHGFEMKREEIARVAVGQSVWDDAAKHLSKLDIEWARFNVRDFFVHANNFEFAAVVGPDNKFGYASHQGHEAGVDVDTFGSATAPLVAKIRERELQLAPIATRVASGDVLASPVQESNLLRVGGDLYAITATLVQPDQTPGLISGPAPITVVGDELNADFLKTLGAAYLVDGLRLAPPQIRSTNDRAHVDFKDAGGAQVLGLEWAPERPGQAMLAVALPMLLAGIALLIGLAIVFHLRARRAVEGLIASEKRASHLAYHDSLTGLPNRALVSERLALAIANARRSGRSFAVHCIDLDRFKEVNDTFGHHVGDELIRHVARALTDTCRGVDTVARLGGDEFVVIQEGCTAAKAAQLADRLVAVLALPVELSTGSIYTGGSIGITLVTQSTARDAAECLREADLALYRAKDGGRGRYCFFEADMDAAIRNRRSLQEDLREAIRGNQLTMFYQPQVDGRNRITGVEALMRWTHPTRGAVSPAVFIPAAEECGLIETLGWFAMRRAFEDSTRWPDIKIAINVSAAQLRIRGFLDQVSQLVAETGIDTKRFEFEITEGLLLADSAETHTVLKGIRDLGFQLALDDFGTGYSSLSYLKRYPITRIKIDRSFISNLGVDEESEDVVAAIVRLARALKMAVVAEGVETTEQRTRLASAGCRDIQGYLASKPLPVEMVQDFIDGFAKAGKSEAA
jgi:diguanylate cyclase (GGDEF)-like protein